MKALRYLPKFCLVLFYSSLALYILHTKFGGLYFLNPKNIDWLLQADWAQHYLGFAFYRNSSWGFPIGNIDAVFPPMGTNIGFMDTLPLFAIPLKLVSSFLPYHFQFIGFWLFLCFVLQGISSYRLLRVLSINIIGSLIGSLLFCYSTALMFRIGHDTLCCHWLILEMIILYVKSSMYSSKKLYKKVIFFSLLTAFIHPYLVLFVLGLVGAIYLRVIVENKKVQNALFGIGSSVVVFLMSWYVIGYFSVSSTSTSFGFGERSSNLNSLYNPNVAIGLHPNNSLDESSVSSFLSTFTLYHGGQHEGFAYLGLGILVSLFIILILVVFGQVSLKISYKNIPLVLCASMLFIFSLSNVITFGDFALLTLPKDGYYAKIGETFRATGRYLWLTYYLLMLFVFWFMNQKINNKFILNILFVFLFLIQYHDVKPLFTSKVTYVDGAGDAVDEGKLINTRGMEKVFISPFYGAENFIEWSLVGYMNRAATTEVYLARYNNEIVSKHVSVLLGNLSNSHILEKEVIVFPKDKGCEYIDFTKLSVTEDTEYYYLKTNNKRKIHEVKYKAFTIEEYLRHRKDKLIILSVKDEGSSSMSLGLRKYLTETNNKLGELDFRQSGLAVVCSDSLYFNQVADSELSYQGVIEGVELFVTSGGKLSSNKSSIIVGGVEYSFNQRGVNIVVIDINTKKVERRLFLDTYSGENLYIIDKVVDE